MAGPHFYVGFFITFASDKRQEIVFHKHPTCVSTRVFYYLCIHISTAHLGFHFCSFVLYRTGVSTSVFFIFGFISNLFFYAYL